MNPTPTLFDVDLSCVKENRVSYIQQDFIKLAKENFELKNYIKELETKLKEKEQIIKNYNAISRKKKK